MSVANSCRYDDVRLLSLRHIQRNASRFVHVQSEHSQKNPVWLHLVISRGHRECHLYIGNKTRNTANFEQNVDLVGFRTMTTGAFDWISNSGSKSFTNRNVSSETRLSSAVVIESGFKIRRWMNQSTLGRRFESCIATENVRSHRACSNSVR